MSGPANGPVSTPVSDGVDGGGDGKGERTFKMKLTCEIETSRPGFADPETAAVLAGFFTKLGDLLAAKLAMDRARAHGVAVPYPFRPTVHEGGLGDAADHGAPEPTDEPHGREWAPTWSSSEDVERIDAAVREVSKGAYSGVYALDGYELFAVFVKNYRTAFAQVPDDVIKPSDVRNFVQSFVVTYGLLKVCVPESIPAASDYLQTVGGVSKALEFAGLPMTHTNVWRFKQALDDVGFGHLWVMPVVRTPPPPAPMPQTSTSP